jgi:transketolase
MTDLEKIARIIRMRTLEQSHKERLTHLGSCLSCTDILVALYFEVMNDDDEFILSKGHAAPVLYQVLVKAGRPLPSRPHGVEETTGSLGHGLPIAVGRALAKKISGEKGNVYVLLGDGECDEGTVWEAARFAQKHKLSNLVAIVDCNGWQATDRCDTHYIHQVWRGFGWLTCRIDGNDMASVVDAVRISDQFPVAVIADTVKGCGVSFMEDDNLWHYRVPSEEEVQLALKGLGL